MTAHNKRNLFNTRLISSPLLVFVALWPNPNWAQNSTLPAPQAQLQQQIEQAEQNFRDDLVVDAIARWQRLNPDAPELLAAQIRYAVKTKDLAQAQTYLGRLREVAPGSALLQQSEQLLAIDKGPLHIQLEQAQLFETAGQLEKARDLYDRVYQGVFPSTDDAINYHLLQLRIQPTDAKAHEALATLFQTHPSHP